MAKRTVIAPNEELLIQGQLTVVGNVVQVEETTVITNIQNEVITVNSDGEDVDATISLNKNDTFGNVTYNGTDIIFNRNIQVPAGGSFKGNILASDNAVVVDHVNKYFIGTVSSISNHNTSDLTEDPSATTTSGTMYFTESRSRASVSVTDTGGDGSLAYNSSSGVITYTGPSASEVRAHFTGGTGITYSSSTGDISITDNVLTDTPGTYGSATHVARTQVNSRGQVTAIAENEINIPHDQITDFDSASRALMSVNDTGGDGSLTYNNLNGVFTYTGPSAAEARAHVSVTDTGGDGSLAYNSGTGVITYTGPSAAEVRAHISVTDNGGDGSLGYNSTSGVISYTGPSLAQVQARIDNSASNVRAHFSGGDGINLASGVIDVDNTVVRTSGNQSIAGTKTFTGTAVGITQAVSDNTTKMATTAYVTRAVNNLIDGAPGTLDTLNEIAAALNDDSSTGSIVTSNTNRITTLEGRNLNAGAGLTGGGDLNADRTFNVGAGNGINVNANSIEVDMDDFTTTDLAEGTNLYYTTARADGRIALQVGSNLDLSQKSTSNLPEGTNLYYTDARVQSYVSGGDGIDFASGVIDVDTTVVRTSGTQSISGTKTFTGELVTPSSSSTTTGAIYYDSSVGEAYIYVGGSARKITPAVDAGDVEDVGLGEVNLYGGTRVDGATTYHGIKSFSSGTYTSISESSNVITVDGDISSIKGAFSASSGINYNSATGAFSADDAEVRSLFSATGTLTYNNSTGAFGSSADNYNNWKFTTATAGDESVTSGEKITFQGSAGISVTHSGSTITITGQSGDIQSVTAGNGLTGGGASGAVSLALDDSHVRGLLSGSNGVNYNSSTGSITADSGEIRALFSAGGDLAYNSTTGVISYTTPTMYTDSDARSSISVSGDLAYNSGTGVISYTTPTERTDAEVRGLISASGDISYNSSTGVVSFTERTDAEVRALFAGSGLLQYNSTTGSITTSADNYGSWTFKEGNGNETGSITSGDTLHFEQGTGMQIELSADDQLTFTNTAPDQTVVLTGTGSTTVSGTYPNFTIDSTDTNTDTNTTYSAGTDLSLSGTQFNVQSAVSATANKIAKRDGSGNLTANTFTGTATQARYADLAEKYASDTNYQPGTVVIFGGNKEITVTDRPDDYRVAGVISTDPAYMMNCDADGQYVALRGRIPCKVIGPIKKGDVLITSERPGFAKKCDQPHFVSAACMVGKALQDHPTPSEGIIEIVV